MGIGDLTRQIAQKAIGDQVKDALSESTAPAEKPVPADAGTVILGQLHAMQKALKEDEELVVLCTVGSETIRVYDVFVPASQVVVLGGVDAEKNTTRVISAIDQLQLVCKPRNVAPPAKPTRVRILTPKPKAE